MMHVCSDLRGAEIGVVANSAASRFSFVLTGPFQGQAQALD